jgi:serine/threonine-protein kinase
MSEPTSSLPPDPAAELLRRWEQGDAPDVEAFLAEAGPLGIADRAAVLRVDQRQRWQASQGVEAEEYLQRHPEVCADAEAAVDLIFHEYLLRERLGERPGKQEYLERFPEYAGVLADQIELHRAVAGSVSAPTLPPEVEGQTLAAAPGEWSELPCVPGYEVLAELGRGGMGVVYRARQRSLNRIVALKMVLAGAHAGAQELARFRAEAEAAARLAHPNIVQVHEVGAHQGRPFFAMEYVEGGSLEEKLGGTPLPAGQAAELVKTLAQAVQAAHDKGVVHRDLKPANVLLTAPARPPAAERDAAGGLAFGVPKITDFGLAKRLDGEVGQTQSGAIMGTPSYMAPEQAAGRSKAVGPACDVWALGAILYECLTGRPPFKGATPLDTILQVLERDPVPVRLLNPKVQRDLETICLRCLEKEPHRRYGSAGALAADLDRFLRGESISIRSVNVLDRLARALERDALGVEFHAWGTVVLLWAAAVLLTHLVLFVWVNPSARRLYLSPLCYAGQFLLMGLAYGRFGPRRAGPASAAEQRLWAVWVGYLIGCGLLLLHTFLMPGFGEPPLCWGTYPASALLTGLAFFVLGGSHWGWFYAFGLAFFALSAVMPLRLEWSPLEFGVLWTAALLVVGAHLRRLGAGTRGGPHQGPAPGA